MGSFVVAAGGLVAVAGCSFVAAGGSFVVVAGSFMMASSFMVADRQRPGETGRAIKGLSFSERNEAADALKRLNSFHFPQFFERGSSEGKAPFRCKEKAPLDVKRRPL